MMCLTQGLAKSRKTKCLNFGNYRKIPRKGGQGRVRTSPPAGVNLRISLKSCPQAMKIKKFVPLPVQRELTNGRKRHADVFVRRSSIHAPVAE